MSYDYTETMLFLETEEGEVQGWTTDCGGKKDYDPVIVRIDSRVYRDGTYIQDVIVGGDMYVFKTDVLHAESQIAARAIVEAEAKKHAERIIAAVKAEYANEVSAHVE